MQTSILALLGLAALFVGLVLNFVMPGIRYYAWIILALGAALLAVAFIFDFRKVQNALISHQGKFGVSTTVGVSLFFGVILLVNAISVGNFHRFDFTGLAQFTLTSQSKDVLKGLDKPVEIVTFFSPTVPPQVSLQGRFLLDEYQLYSDQLTLRNLDPDLNPDQARQYGLNRLGAQYGSVVFKSEAGQTQVYGPQIVREAEHAFTSAILQVTGTRQKKIYFLKGHGENTIQNEYAKARGGLKDNLFLVGELDLLNGSGIPQDAAALVIPGPDKDLDSRESKLLQGYLQEDGKLLVLLNPNPPESWLRLLSEWGLDVTAGTLIDPASHVAPNLDHPLVPRNQNSFGFTEVYFPGAAGLLPQKDLSKNLKIQPLTWSSRKSWIEKDFSSSKDPQFDPERDQKGPFAIGAMINKGGTSIVVIGDSDFAANKHFYNGNNSDLFLSVINRLAASSEVISVDRKVLPARRLLLSPEQVRFLHVSSIGLFPFLLLILGGYVRWRRR
ncbi:MAG: GldG family protein [SAR324 cluster bacterium]|nr:GldG family protein [SAR324 cluster bacterium]